VHLIAIV